jgi:heat shock protein HslJ
MTVRFEANQAYWTAGCNNFHAPYAIESGRFQLSRTVTSTLVGCPREVSMQTSALAAALYGARAVRLQGGQLTLMAGDGSVLATLAAQDLRGTTWQVDSYNNGKQALVSVLKGSSLTLEFSLEGMLSGSAGCNRYSGRYSAEGVKVSVGDLASTQKVCGTPEGVMEQERAFLIALPNSVNSRMEGNWLELRDASGALVVMAAPPTAP